MATYVLPNIKSGGSITVSGDSLQQAQQAAASQTGVSLSAQQGGGTFGGNTNPSLGGGGSSSSGGGGGSTASAQNLGAITQSIVGALASGNKAAFDEAVREFNATFGLDTQKFTEATRQFNQTFGLQQAALSGTYNGQPTEAARQFNVSQGLNALQLAGSLHADPFRQVEVEGQLNRLLNGQGVPGFSAPNGSAANTQSIDYLLNQIRDPYQAQNRAAATLNDIPAPNQLNAVEFFRSPPATQSLLLSGIKSKFGIDEADALQQIKNTLPGFASPAIAGAVKV